MGKEVFPSKSAEGHAVHDGKTAAYAARGDN
jgi:hypothetical protein